METQVKVYEQCGQTHAQMQVATRRVSRAKRDAKCIFIFLFAALLGFNSLLFSRAASASSIVQYWENRMGSHAGFTMEPRLSYFSTSQNYDVNGNAANLFYPGASVNQVYADLNLSYGFSENWFLFGRLSVLSSTVKIPGAPDQSIKGLSDQLIGTAYRLFSTDGGFSWNLQGDATLPAYNDSTQKTNHDPYLGDGSTDLTIGTFFEIPFSLGSMHALFVEAGAGYQYRSKAFSADIPFSLMIKRDPEFKGLVFSLGVRGEHSLSTDTTSPSVQATDQNLGAGGSNLVFALNPSWIVGQATIGVKTAGGTTWYALGSNTITGTNSANGYQVSIGAQFDFGTAARETESRDPVVRKENHAPKSIRSGVRPNQFTTYDLEAKVLSVSDQFYLAKIDKGLDDGVDKGQIFDIFKVTEDSLDQKDKEVLVARAQVKYVKSNEAALTVIEYYQDKWIDAGFVARREVK
jgi:hypothetical protein